MLVRSDLCHVQLHSQFNGQEAKQGKCIFRTRVECRRTRCPLNGIAHWSADDRIIMHAVPLTLLNLDDLPFACPRLPGIRHKARRIKTKIADRNHVPVKKTGSRKAKCQVEKKTVSKYIEPSPFSHTSYKVLHDFFCCLH